MVNRNRKNAYPFNCYAKLGLNVKVSKSEIDKRYKVLSKENHPDSKPASQKKEYTKKQSEINKAYQVLTQDRKNHDWWLLNIKKDHSLSKKDHKKTKRANPKFDESYTTKTKEEIEIEQRKKKEARKKRDKQYREFIKNAERERREKTKKERKLEELLSEERKAIRVKKEKEDFKYQKNEKRKQKKIEVFFTRTVIFFYVIVAIIMYLNRLSNN
tara:strand:+ start:22 stop:663 length:642 start_codon:yes stop_codon:yes gene_type:complete